LQSLIRELKSAANARGISIEPTTTGWVGREEMQ
jgi:hypothetical protein